MKKIVVLIGGVSRDSLNRRFFEAVAGLVGETGETGGAGPGSGPGPGPGQEHGAGAGSRSESGPEFEWDVADIASLPHFSQDLEVSPPASVEAFRRAVSAADGVLIVTPEYNRSIPGVLKNALDWGSRPPGANIWAGRPTAVMGASTGAIGTFGAQQHLRNICSWLDMPVMNQPTVYFNASTGMAGPDGRPDASGNRLTDSSAAFLRKFLTSFETFIIRSEK